MQLRRFLLACREAESQRLRSILDDLEVELGSNGTWSPCRVRPFSCTGMMNRVRE